MIQFAQPFALERDMLEPLRAGLSGVAPGLVPAGSTVAKEVTVGRIIPDLVAGTLSPAAYRLARARPTHLHCLVISLAHGYEAISATMLREKHYISVPTGSRILAELGRRGFLDQDGERFTLNQDDRLEGERLSALEVKLKRWREALDQATAYQGFADQVAVVLDGNQVRVDDEMRSRFGEAGVGLILQYQTIGVEEIPCQRRPVMSADRVWVLTKLGRLKAPVHVSPTSRRRPATRLGA